MCGDLRTALEKNDSQGDRAVQKRLSCPLALFTPEPETVGIDLQGHSSAEDYPVAGEDVKEEIVQRATSRSCSQGKVIRP